MFDVIGWHLLRQGTRATAFDGVKCLYRAMDGKRCAIGWIIPDEVYERSLEFLGVRDLAARLIESEHAAFARVLYRHMPLLRDLQEMHDARHPFEWPFALRVIAQRHQLNVKVVAQCERSFDRTGIAPHTPMQLVSPVALLSHRKVKPASIAEDFRNEELNETPEFFSD
ncbi:hypothetical protein [Paraburkholderia graminis]|uniref:hypothetical protein n=1 Tax=Paraburkholderia graminis TaxID=60548 RepID=UPI0012F4B6CF|nr:hypothetical protein [Paraburkholderia graminis]